MTEPTEKIVAEAKSSPAELTNPPWQGRFPYNEIITLLDVNRPFNLAESTSQDLTVGDVLDLAGMETLRGLKLGRAMSSINFAPSLGMFCLYFHKPFEN